MKKIYTLLSIVFLVLLLTGCAKEMILKDFQKNPGEKLEDTKSTWFEYSDEQKEKLITEKLKKEELDAHPFKEIVEGINHLYANTEYTLGDLDAVFDESIESYERVVAFEEENSSPARLVEKTVEEEQSEKDLQEFIDIYTQAFRNEDAETIYDTWDSSIDSDAEEREEGIKEWEEELKVYKIKEY
ncbi:hypothetical protein [Planomicrobium sp. CPCC 101110]|uniref:hypothetical protein n=1 Tax=Planomicrobium sp. CPCC 101110 TaxID=2599619 RepID=UPI0011B629F3|nr:hypothetical protein [Planomicrobium sp. CPCC 101110]TWT27742.1 hypothetical protein FQV30_04310 [Planomicrobium sp. CPCC 101110]